MDHDEEKSRKLLLAEESARCWQNELRSLKVLQVNPNHSMEKEMNVLKKTFGTTDSQTRLFL